MNRALKFLLGLTLTAAPGLPVVCQAGNITNAEITRIVRDVRTIDPASKTRPAVLKETIKGNESVRTGIDSRTELLFNDRSITRLGSNTHFSFTEGTRELSLDRGTMLLQVPKGIGGAQINMPAVTAGITGTTIMLEADKAFIKLIVLEGQCCLWRTANKRRKVCAKAGQEIILFYKMKEMPTPFYVDLKILERTSTLITGHWGARLDQGPITAAANAQGGNFVSGSPQTGPGTSTIVTQQLIPQSPPQSGQGTHPVIPPTVVTPPSAPSTNPNGPIR